MYRGSIKSWNKKYVWKHIWIYGHWINQVHKLTKISSVIFILDSYRQCVYSCMQCNQCSFILSVLCFLETHVMNLAEEKHPNNEQSGSHTLDNSDVVPLHCGCGFWVVRLSSFWVSRGKEMLGGGVWWYTRALHEQ